MNSLLDQAAESMDNTEGKNGTSEREFYESLSEKGKRDYLNKKEQKLESELKAKRQEQIDLIKDMDGAELAKFLDEDATDTAILQAQDAIFALNNNYLYDYIPSSVLDILYHIYKTITIPFGNCSRGFVCKKF